MPPKKMVKTTQSFTKTFTRASGTNYLVGAHVSTKGGVQESVNAINEMGGNAFALFLKNQRTWAQKPYDPQNVEDFKDNCKTLNYDQLKCSLPHSSYLINLGNPEREKRDKSYACFLDDLRRCEQLGIGLYNIHPGSTLGTDRAETIKRIADGINRAHGETKFVKVVLENMAGRGNIIGSTLEDLQEMIELVEDKSRVGVCIDTCHTFAAGYDLRTEETFNAFWDKFDKIVGYKYLSAIHLNDSKGPFDSKMDLHQNIGLGFLGLECFRLIMNKKELQDLPMILETPADGDGDKNAASDSRGNEIKLLEWLIGKSSDDTDVIEKSKKLQAKGAEERQKHLSKYNEKLSKSAKSAAKGQRTLNFQKKRKRDEDEDDDSD